MATIPKISAKFETTISLSVNIGDVTATLTSAADAGGTPLPDGTYGFTIDEGNASFEYFEASLVGTALTSIKSFDETTLAETTGFSKAHRAGAEIKITDYTVLGKIVKILRGEEGFDAATPLSYASSPTLSDGDELATVQYVLDNVNGGTVDFNPIKIPGIAGETLSSGDWVYLKVSDGRWYQADASDSAKSRDVIIGKALSAGTAGAAISGKIFLWGLETSGTYTGGNTYYLSDTAGQAATSPGTEEVILGVADDNDDLIFTNLFDKESVTAPEKDALGGTVGTPSSTNKYVTDSELSAYAFDQEQTTDDGAIEFGESDATTQKNKLAQSFKPEKKTIRGVTVRKEATTGSSFTGTVSLAIQADTSGEPSGSDLASVTLTNQQWQAVATDADVEFEFSTELSVTQGDTYWVVLTSSTADNSNHPNVSINSAGGYASGGAYYNNTTDGWVALTGQDIYFKTLEGVQDRAVKTNSSGLIPQDFIPNNLIPNAMQLVTFQDGTETTSTNADISGSTASSDGSVFYFISNLSSNLVRVERDTITGQYYQTHTATLASATAGMSIVELGDYVYTFYDGGTNVAAERLDKSDLANKVTMTLPVIASPVSGGEVHAWTTGEFIYIQASSTNTCYKCSVSGTTLTQVSTGTVSSTLTNLDEFSTFFDGKDVYIVRGSSGSSITQYRLTSEYGNTLDTGTGIGNHYSANYNVSSAEGCIAIPIDDDRIFFGDMFALSTANSSGAQVTYAIRLRPITKNKD